MVDDSHVEDRLTRFCMDSKKIPGNAQTLRGYLRAWRERLGSWERLEEALWGLQNGLTVIEIQDRLFEKKKAGPKAVKGGCDLCLGTKKCPVDVKDGAWVYAQCPCQRRHGPRKAVDTSRYLLPWKRPEIASEDLV